MKITVLIENTSNCSLTCEHGLSMLIENNEVKILLDAGATSAFAENADKLGVNLSEIEICILSHGHYDHSGGFERLFQINKKAKIYAQKTALNNYYSSKGGMHEISVPKEVITNIGRFEQTEGFREISHGVYLVPHNTQNLEKTGEKAGLYKTENGCIVPDDFAHEQSLVFDTPNGLVIFNSCSHGGAENIIREAKQFCNNKQVYAYVGGLHMKGTVSGEEVCTFSDDEIESLCNAIINENISYVYTGHCTGIKGYDKLKAKLGCRLRHLTTGIQFEL